MIGPHRLTIRLSHSQVRLVLCIPVIGRLRDCLVLRATYLTVCLCGGDFRERSI